ncbi:MAG: hypothetical protein JSU70_16445 [Phycisphaerales bacterium]|nr:MAG: hypothetical protein JSU70_16445 [Phycisphaerales bacterium]
MQRQNITHVVLFVVFFSIGATSLGGSVLCDDLVRHYRNKDVLRTARESLERLESLNAEYDVLLGQLEEDPNLIKRVAPVTLGTKPTDPNAAYPRARAQELAAARKALLETEKPPAGDSAVPTWLIRCSEPRRRMALAVSGAVLILISLACFAPAHQSPESKQQLSADS